MPHTPLGHGPQRSMSTTQPTSKILFNSHSGGATRPPPRIHTSLENKSNMEVASTYGDCWTMTRTGGACPPTSTGTSAPHVIRTRPTTCTREQTPMHHTLPTHHSPQEHHTITRSPTSRRPFHHTQHVSLHPPHPESTPSNSLRPNHTLPTRLSQLTPPS